MQRRHPATTVLRTASAIASIVAAGEDIVVGTTTGRLETWRLCSTGDARLISTRQLALAAPVEQLQVLGDVGLVIHRCAGVVCADTVDRLQLLATLHPSRATAFHADSSGKVSSLAVCAGHSMVWVYELASTPRLTWRKQLPQATRAIYLRADCALVACESSCFILCAASGEILAELSLDLASTPCPPPAHIVGAPPATELRSWPDSLGSAGASDAATPSAAWRSSGRFVQLSESHELLLLLPAVGNSPTAGQPASSTPGDGSHGGGGRRPGLGSGLGSAPGNREGRINGEREVVVWVDPVEREIRTADELDSSCEDPADAWQLLPGLLLIRTPTTLLLRSHQPTAFLGSGVRASNCRSHTSWLGGVWGSGA